MSNGEVVKTGDARLAEFLAAGTTVAPIDPEQAAMEIVRRILAANDVESVLRQQEAIHARDVLNEPLKIVGFDVNESTMESGPAFYMLVRCVDAEGEPFSVTCGAVNVMAQLFRLGELDAFPLDAKIVESAKPTKAGYRPMWLEASPAPF